MTPIYTGQIGGRTIRFYKPFHENDGLFPWVCGEDLIKAFGLTGKVAAASNRFVSTAPEWLPQSSHRIAKSVTALSFEGQNGLINGLLETNGIDEDERLEWIELLLAAAVPLYPEMFQIREDGQRITNSGALAQLFGMSHDDTYAFLDKRQA
jgi:hypothetical protein